MLLFVIQLVCWLGWLSSFTMAQLDISEGITGSVNFPALGITCLGNLAVFVTSLIRGRLDLEIGARDVLDILKSPKLEIVNGIKHGSGLTTCEGDLQTASVVMLSNGTPNWSMRQFIKSNASIVKSILLQFLFFKDAINDEKVREELTIQSCECSQPACHCIVFWTVQPITNMLASRMPGTLKLLSNSLCLLPCRQCLTNGCHDCHRESLLRVEGQADESVVSDMLENIGAQSISAGEPVCICIPMNDARRDNWTKLLVRSLRSKDAAGRGVTVMASEALEGYLAGGRGGEEGTVEYHILSFIVPRLTEVLINLVLTFWFRVDGFSSALVARRTIRDYLVDSKGNGFAANALLTKAEVKSDDNSTQVCQALFFRGSVLCIITFVSTGCANFICSLGWAVLISFEGGVDSSPPPSMPVVVLIIAAIGAALGMDIASDAFGRYRDFERTEINRRVIDTILFVALWPVTIPIRLILGLRNHYDITFYGIMFWTAVTLEAACIEAGSAVAGTLGIRGFRRWIYGALQILVWAKWATGSYFLNHRNSREFFGESLNRWEVLMYSSAPLLNAVLAGVRCKWEPWPWKDNHLFSRKLGP